MKILKHELGSMDTNISKVWRLLDLLLLQKKETQDFSKPLTQLAHRLFTLILFYSRFFIGQFKLIMINCSLSKSSLSKRRRKVQQNSVIYIVIFVQSHQFCGQEEGAQWSGKERLGESSGEESTCMPELDASADCVYNSVHPSSSSKLWCSSHWKGKLSGNSGFCLAGIGLLLLEEFN